MGRRGALSVEMALISPVLIVLMFAAIEYGLYQMTRQVVSSAAEAAARRAISSTQTATTAQVQAVATSQFAALPLTNPSVSVYLSDSSGNNLGSWSSARFGQTIAVKVTGTYRQAVPKFGLMPATTTITTTVLLRCEVD